MEFLQDVIKYFLNVEWLQVLRTAATIALAFIAWKGLNTWRHQTTTQIKTKFIDELIDTVNEYVLAMSGPIHMVGFVAMGIQSYSKTAYGRGNTDENAGFINYIEARGEKTGEKIFQYLENTRPITAKIKSLSNKGQVLGFDGYDKVFKACEMLIWSHAKIEGLGALIIDPQWNWENQKVQETLSKYRDIKSDDIRRNLEKYHLELLDFSKNTYQALLT